MVTVEVFQVRAVHISSYTQARTEFLESIVILKR